MRRGPQLLLLLNVARSLPSCHLMYLHLPPMHHFILRRQRGIVNVMQQQRQQQQQQQQLASW